MHVATHLVLLLLLVVVLVGATSYKKKPKAPSFQIGSE